MTATAAPDLPRPGSSESALVEPVLTWFEADSRSLPWRAPDAGPWAVLVSEFMLQQTPVSRVLPVYLQWLGRWPTPAALAAEPAGTAVRAWGRLGYPRRALRLHAAAVAIVASHGGAVPTGLAQLKELPGVGDYTAAAVASFAFRQRHAVLDTNVRRVLARAVSGRAFPAPAVTLAERRLAESLLPTEPERAARFSVGLMELGALMCQARTPSCDRCPVRARCAWRLAGSPPDSGPPRRGQSYHGTDRQVRGRLLAVLRDSTGPVSLRRLAASWPDDVPRSRALDGLLTDGLVVALPRKQYALPGEHSPGD
jgi:A/G-specific adenine glycosylase